MIFRGKRSFPLLYNLLQPARKKRFKTVFLEQQGIFSEAPWRFLKITMVNLWMQTACRKAKISLVFCIKKVQNETLCRNTGIFMHFLIYLNTSEKQEYFQTLYFSDKKKD